jgi:hypothetical protein
MDGWEGGRPSGGVAAGAVVAEASRSPRVVPSTTGRGHAVAPHVGWLWSCTRACAPGGLPTPRNSSAHAQHAIAIPSALLLVCGPRAWPAHAVLPVRGFPRRALRAEFVFVLHKHEAIFCVVLCCLRSAVERQRGELRRSLVRAWAEAPRARRNGTATVRTTNPVGPQQADSRGAPRSAACHIFPHCCLPVRLSAGFRGV